MLRLQLSKCFRSTLISLYRFKQVIHFVVAFFYLWRWWFQNRIQLLIWFQQRITWRCSFNSATVFIDRFYLLFFYHVVVFNFICTGLPILTFFCSMILVLFLIETDFLLFKLRPCGWIDLGLKLISFLLFQKRCRSFK